MEKDPAQAGLVAQPLVEPGLPLARERRLHARAFAQWHALRGTRAVPQLSACDPRALPEAAPRSFLAAVAGEDRVPQLHFVGNTLAEEAGLGEGTAPDLTTLPRASLLGQLARHLPRVLEQAMPLAFEYDGPGADGAPTHHRGILLPYADAQDRIAYVQGIVGWRRVADVAIDADVSTAIETSLKLRPRALAACPWACAGSPAAPPLSISRQLATARMWVELAATDRVRGAAHLAAALSAAHDLLIIADADPAAFGTATGARQGDALDQAVQAVFGPTLSWLPRARYRAVLLHARRLGLGAGMLLPLIERHPGGAPALAQAEARARRIGLTPAATPSGRVRLSPVDPAYLLGIASRGDRAPTTPAPATAIARR